ncbi:MAG: TetR/AcrR family transcriptional regulator [Spirochaetaceae bacterium]|nr:TetR/AcrR family transcriptional regulator [Spirochaetaceae bacterium]
MSRMVEITERKQEILDAALSLFSEKGYSKTSIGDIQDVVGIARGTMYYHFSSKEEILDALIMRLHNTVITKAKRLAENKNIPVPERLLQVLMSLRIQEDHKDSKVLSIVHSSENALFHQKMQSMIVSGITPVLTVIIEDGIAQGLYITKYPYEAMEMIVAYISTVIDSHDDALEDEKKRKTAALLYNAERLLGIEENSFSNILKHYGIS